ncbi:TetR/AcrR family transcriptional regulator [Arachnia propionica]|uniref:TetR/AcrR family transcriptional regulator n=1 Tax=Arachnia propionica TaxID=1750 RepID=UPI00163AA5CD|nr:TetR/AcrR family transcriptional regulator [Arachnia propionica]
MATRGRGRPRAAEGRDLRAELLRVSRQVLDEGGPALLSLREVARRADCTHQAPYHHFPNREALLAALVAEGFDQLAAMLRRARVEAEGDVLEASANAYVEFALRNPGVFRVMFRVDVCDPKRYPEVQASGGLAREELRLVVAADGAAGGDLAESACWAHVHGLATLLLDGPLGLEHVTLDQRLSHAGRVNRALRRPEERVE